MGKDTNSIGKDSENIVRSGVSKVKREDAGRVIGKEAQIKTKLSGLDPDKYSGLIGNVKLFFDMLKDWWNEKYHAPWFTIAGIIFALLYFINPFDLIPDFIPGVGYLDDAAVFSIVAGLASEDLAMYKKWKVEQG